MGTLALSRTGLQTLRHHCKRQQVNQSTGVRRRLPFLSPSVAGSSEMTGQPPFSRGYKGPENRHLENTVPFVKTVCEGPTAALEQPWVPEASGRGRCSGPAHCGALSAHRPAGRGQGGLGTHLCRSSDGRESTGDRSREAARTTPALLKTSSPAADASSSGPVALYQG